MSRGREVSPETAKNFRTYLRRLPIWDSPSGEFVAEAQNDRVFPALTSWAGYEKYLERAGYGNETIKVAHGLWWRFRILRARESGWLELRARVIREERALSDQRVAKRRERESFKNHDMGKSTKHPTPEEIASYNPAGRGARQWHHLGPHWRCPSCLRARNELIHWAKLTPNSPRIKTPDGWGWTAGLHEHHCHGRGRFPETVICSDCNSADGAAKRKLKLPETWSFSPSEIGEFVTCEPYSGRTKIDYVRAHDIARNELGEEFTG